ncbi:MAG: EI24 domain-containing protein [Chlorobi bacterium]|nr:EI24 domain-containing protein [Chlorobiota bacterium]
MPSNIIKGLTVHFRAARLILRDAEVRRCAQRPLLVNILLMIVGLPLGVWGAIELSGLLVSGDGLLAAVARTFLQILGAAIGVFVSFFLLLLIGSAIAGPLNSKLSLAVEQHLRGPGFRAGDTSLMQDAARSVAFSLGRLVMFVLCYPPIFFTQFIPGIGFILFPALSLLYAAVVLSLDFSDYVFERHFTTFRQKVRHVWGRKSLYFGFGGGLALLLLIPLAGFVILPVGVVGATMLYVEETS